MTGGGIIRRAGFYASAEEVSAVATSVEHPWERSAARYLEEGEIVVAASQWVDDLLDARSKRICQYSVRTDGVWVWPSSLVYYVKKYHVKLPAEFLNRMTLKDWTVGELGEDAVEEIYERLVDFDEST
ncbi:hypothetical protein OG250_18465 [Streptomyces sp. NBC_00487]|uniref:hypothetical protein n=1 Tax=unclassified Streptomyces TaxID=2593676 RepID=UPI002E16DC21|nr:MULTISPECIES: hypothetical protein [unclassified Streptomyces]